MCCAVSRREEFAAPRPEGKEEKYKKKYTLSYFFAVLCCVFPSPAPRKRPQLSAHYRCVSASRMFEKLLLQKFN